ncbi:MAG: methyltransferase domain-containing protein [Gammaproteobacteria bacterium]|nr:methyltransferase domain-containing protein [Gammaproteobacteria bacterium]MBU2546216.1 methyltransferase domain-containing protein [Gammaproteobacteria bacterium]
MSQQQCLLCHSDLNIIDKDLFDTRFGIDETYNIAQCPNCHLVQLSPQPSQEYLQKLYESHYNFSASRHPRESGDPELRHPRESGDPELRHPHESGDPELRHPLEGGGPELRHPRESGDPALRHPRESGDPEKLNNWYTRLRSLFYRSFFYPLWLKIDGDIAFHALRGKGRLLDIGCNEGRGLKIFKQHGFEPEGIELNTNAAQLARQKGFQVYTVDLKDFHPEEKYDVAILSNVIEHALDPKTMLQDIARVLKPGGQLYLSTPNINSRFKKGFGRYWVNWHIPFHITFFSKQTLSQLLHDSGFDVVSIHQESPSLWVTLSILAKCFSKKGKVTKQMRNPILVMLLLACIRGFCFPYLWWLNRKGEGDCLVIKAKAKIEAQ